MIGTRWTALALFSVLAASGCQSTAHRRSVALAEPPLNAGADPDAAVVEAPPARSLTFADRHPLFAKPREYYESSGNNKVVKAAAATVIGVPAGLFGEIRQIVVGQTPAKPAY